MGNQAKPAKTKLHDIFPDTLSYHFEKVFEGIYRPEYAELGRVNVEFIQGVVEDFKAALRQRGIDTVYPGINETLELVDYPLQELKNYFQHSSSAILNDKSAHIFTYFASRHIKDLQNMAGEIDQEHSNK